MIDSVSSVRTALPVVDLRDEPGALRDRLRSVAHDVGFFHLTVHGVSATLTQRVLASARRLLALPQADKDAIAMGVLTLLLAEPDSAGLEVRVGSRASEATGSVTRASEATGSVTRASEATGSVTRASEATGSVTGEWIEANPLPGAFVVNIGEMLEIASGGHLRATEHRVRLFARERISVPYFFDPRLDARFPVLTLPAELAAQARGITADRGGERIFSVYGRNAWNSRLRAHPDVAAAHEYV